MDSESLGRVVLMSIRPPFADAILRGEKQVEFRKTRIADDVTHVVVYATSPVAAIVGAFTVRAQDTLPPDHLWRAFGAFGSIDYDEFSTYFESSRVGTGIQVGDVFLSRERIGLFEAFGIKRPPQSFQYLDIALAKTALERMDSI